MTGKQRPVIKLYGNDAIIDTGAVIPMVSLSPELVKLAWNAELVKENIEIGGIGGKAEGDIYTLHNFEIYGFKFNNLDVFIPKIPDTKYIYLLSCTMFYGTDFSFDMINKDNQSFTINIPDNVNLNRNFKIKDLNGQLYAQVDGILIQDEYVSSKEIINYSQYMNIKETEDDIER